MTAAIEYVDAATPEIRAARDKVEALARELVATADKAAGWHTHLLGNVALEMAKATADNEPGAAAGILIGVAAVVAHMSSVPLDVVLSCIRDTMVACARREQQRAGAA